MQEWFLPKITDYWDWKSNALEKFSLELMVAEPTARDQQLSIIRSAVTEHVRVLSAQQLLNALIVAAEDIYKAANRATVGGSAIEMYLEASAGTLFSVARQRQCILHYLVDNIFEQTSFGMTRPLKLFGAWFRAAQLVYICPQELAVRLMQNRNEDPDEFISLLPRYIDEALDVSNKLVERCHAESRHYTFLNADSSPEPFPFRACLAVAKAAGLITVLRNEAPVAGSKITVIYPRSDEDAREGA